MPHLSPQTKLSGRYVITQHLGSGGFGQTYLAQDLQLPGKPQCVVKQFRPQVTTPQAIQTAQRLFETEAEVLYKLGDHPQIPRLLAHFEEGGEFFLVQEFVEGHGLDRELLPGRRLSEADSMAMVQEILEILTFVHQQNVIHRDIKPSNLMRRSSDRKLVLIDFGAVKQISAGPMIAADLAGTSPQASVTVSVGTPGYMPNEQMGGKPRFCSDLYAVGIMGIQALTGILPQLLPEDFATGELVWHDQAQASPELMQLLDGMTRYDFRQRYQSAQQTLQALGVDPHTQPQPLDPMQTQPMLEPLPQRAIPPTVQALPPIALQPGAAPQASTASTQLIASAHAAPPSSGAPGPQRLLWGGLIGLGLMGIGGLGGWLLSSPPTPSGPTPSSSTPTPLSSTPIPSAPAQDLKSMGTASTGEAVLVDAQSI